MATKTKSKSRSRHLDAEWGEMNGHAQRGHILLVEALCRSHCNTGHPRQGKPVLYNTVLKACAKDGDPLRAELWYHRLRSHVAVNEKTFGKLVEAASKVEDLDLARRWLEAMLQEVGESNIVAVTSALRSCAAEGLQQDASALVEWAEERGIRLDLQGSSAMVSALSKSGDHQAAEAALERLEDEGRELDVVAFNTAIRSAALANKWELALQRFQSMKEAAVSPTVQTYGTIIDALGKSRPPKEALHVLQEARLAAVQPNAICYNTVLSACAKAKLLTEAENVLKQMQADQIDPDVHTYTNLIHVCAKVGQPGAASAWMERAKASGTMLDIFCYNTLLSAHSKARNLDGALQLFEDIRTASLRPSNRTYTAALQSVIGSGERGRQAADYLLQSLLKDESVLVDDFLSKSAERAGASPKLQAEVKARLGLSAPASRPSRSPSPKLIGRVCSS